jgi:galactose mutarotase-like enzyme
MPVTLQSNHLTVLINSFAAELSSVKNKNNIEFIWQADKTVWARHAPVLFPIVGKLKDDHFIFEDKSYQLPQHGFARDMEFESVSENRDACVFRLVSNSETLKKYPFDFIFEIKYQLEENILTTFYTVKNPSEKILYFSVGAHPGFNCPLLPGEKLEDYYLEFEKSDLKTTVLTNGLRNDYNETLALKNNRLFLTSSLFDKDALVFENNQVNALSLGSAKSSHKIVMDCKNWPFFGIWSKKGSNQFVCLEPWYGIADSVYSTHQFASKKGILSLNPFSEFNCSYSVHFS